MDTKIYHVYTKIKIFIPDRWQRQCLKYLNFAKEEGESAIEKKPRPTNTIVDKGWFSLAEFLSSLKINSYVSHFVPQKRRAGFQLKLKILSNRIQNYI